MMNRTASLLATALLMTAGGTAALSAQTSPRQNTTPQPTSNMDNMHTVDNMPNANALSDSDQQFLSKASSDGAAEVEMGQLATQKAQSAKTREFAQQMVKDHSRANKDLAALAQRKHGTVAKQPPSTEAMDKLQSLSGADFDKAYLAIMLSAHQKAIDLFTQASHSNDADVKSFATQTLPTLKHHLEMAQALAPSSSPGMP